jgi:hypothetical protein
MLKQGRRPPGNGRFSTEAHTFPVGCLACPTGPAMGAGSPARDKPLAGTGLLW